MTDYENLYLVYIEPIGKNLLDWYEYEFIFSETPDIVLYGAMIGIANCLYIAQI